MLLFRRWRLVFTVGRLAGKGCIRVKGNGYLIWLLLKTTGAMFGSAAPDMKKPAKWRALVVVQRVSGVISLRDCVS